MGGMGGGMGGMPGMGGMGGMPGMGGMGGMPGMGGMGGMPGMGGMGGMPDMDGMNMGGGMDGDSDDEDGEEAQVDPHKEGEDEKIPAKAEAAADKGTDNLDDLDGDAEADLKK